MPERSYVAADLQALLTERYNAVRMHNARLVGRLPFLSRIALTGKRAAPYIRATSAAGLRPALLAE